MYDWNVVLCRSAFSFCVKRIMAWCGCGGIGITVGESY